MRVKSWLSVMTNWLMVRPAVPDNVAVDVAATYLRGDAHRLWLAKERTFEKLGKNPADWEVFRQAMMRWYGPIDPVTRTKIDALVQTGSLQAYMRELVILFGDLNEPSSTGEMVYVFFRGLKPELAERVSRIDPSTGKYWASFDAAARHVLMHDSLLQAYLPPTDDAVAGAQGGRKRKAARLS
jgi:hypothetical protein